MTVPAQPYNRHSRRNPDKDDDMSSVSRFKSPNGVTYPFPASRTWGVGLPALLLGLGFGYKIVTLRLGFINNFLILIFAFAVVVALSLTWMGAASIIGAMRRSIGVTVTSEGVSSTSIFGTRWAEWSSLGSFTEGTINAGKQGVLPSVSAPIVGLGASRGLLRKQAFLIADVFGIPASQLAVELNSSRLGVDTLAAGAASLNSGRVAVRRRLSVLTVIVTGIAVVVFCLQFYRLLTL